MIGIVALALCAWQTTPLSAAQWQKSIEREYAGGQRRFELKPGTYRMREPVGDFYLQLSHISDAQIVGKGVTLLLPDSTKGGFRFSQCARLVLSGFTIRHDPLPFSQGRILSLDSNRKSMTVEVSKGYPDDLDNPEHFPKQPAGYVFDPSTRQWKAGTSDLFVSMVTRQGPRTFRFDLGNSANSSVVAGDLLAWRGIGRQGILLDLCSHIDVDSVTIQAAGIFGVHEDGGEGGNKYRNFRVTYPPRPDGADEVPLMSNGADAFHSSGVKAGPTLEGCLLEGMPDDGIAIHGMYGQVAEAHGERLVVGAIYGIQAEVGDTYRIYDRTGLLRSTATIRQVRPLAGFTPARKSSHPAFGSPSGYFEVQLDRSVDAEFDGLVCSEQRTGSGFAIRNCQIRNNRARGILIKASDGVVEGNTVDGSTICGILVAPEGYWMEADFSRHVRILNNTIRNTGYATAGPWTYPAGALSIVADGFEAAGQEGIDVDGNTFENVDGINLMVTNAKDVRITNNRFVATQKRQSDRGADFKLATDALIWIANATGVKLSANRVEQSPTAADRRLVVGPKTSGIISDWKAAIQ